MPSKSLLDNLATEVYRLMKEKKQVLVAAESCTAGLISATLARVPGMSACLAGSFVVYQVESKAAWLEVPVEAIRHHGVVSAEVAEWMASQALHKTAHATVAISITGHLGPDAPATLDGLAWLGWVTRVDLVRSHRLTLESDFAEGDVSKREVFRRHHRQENAVIQSLGFLRDRLAEMT